MSLSKEQLEQAIKSDEKSLRNFSERMRELRARAKENMHEEDSGLTGP